MALTSALRQLVVIASLLLLARPANVAPVGAASVPECWTVMAPALVYAVNGVVFRVDPDGQNRCRLTSSIRAEEPQLSPDGRRLALLSGVGSHGDGRSNGNTVRVVRVGQPPLAGEVVRAGSGLHGRLAWSPDGQKIAFVSQRGVQVWRVACNCIRLVLPSGGANLQVSFAWSWDSRRLAVYLPPAQPSSSSTRITLRVVDIAANTRSTVTVTFPSWIHGLQRYSGSFPSGIVAWLPAGDLLLRTSGYGIGVAVTSLWRAPGTGGAARMIVGLPATQRIWLKYPLLNASQALVSPDGARVLLDPNRGLWIGTVSGGAGRGLSLPIYGSCALSQIAWVGNGHVAYVTVCSQPGAGTIRILARLYALSLSGGSPRQLVSDQSTRQDNLSIEAPTRCIACGAG